ncbi:MAG: glutamate-5-semialdehyde dehydrogenase [Phycisphaerales bacterium]|nr:glutamate-5-semialdehyde dehydrogenase [Phycisphaerales bacterium]MCB9857502.1 glutamate-5-semialdehyde dehydrogenase [Phycisphaerales bacterium]MCB9864513.1 glutamate-5-semialdehyde dehydrogenase [Phycisphaerales bacterium]
MTRAIESTAAAARKAAGAVAILTTKQKNAVLLDLAARIDQSRTTILRANQQDLDAATANGVTGPKLKRLTLSADSIGQMVEGLRQIANLPDPIGGVTKDYAAPSGLAVRKQRCPIGVIMMIYEARPNVTIDAFALCFKAGNACILKGGREALHSNEILATLARDALGAAGIPAEALTLLTTSDRETVKRLLAMEQYIDLVIPRGGTELIRFVHEHARIPTVQHFHGVCHIYVDKDVDIDKAVHVCATAKTSAPATCNAAEAVLVHESVADAFVPMLARRLQTDGVEIHGDARICSLAPNAKPATDDDWGHEYLDLIVAMKVVSSLDAAIEHIHQYGSNHTEAILTTNETAAAEFTQRVQSSCVLVNASTRFNDGFQLGLGAEIGISTSKIHAYGPMGLEELTTQRYVVQGDWHTR